NLFALNQDDHSKNWAFLLDDTGQWRPAPFYDLTFSPNPHGEQSTAFAGYGKNPPLKAMQQLARQANFSSWKQAQAVIGQVVAAVQEWDAVAKALGVKADTRRLIRRNLDTVYQQNKSLLGAVRK
ncbi:MAG: HipA domain-containing protein, partial [Gammaproteobacteria bacterium]|nr:HipA domain-containing protein [Gammaproteobacteria bacterium]MBU1656046.1 HipA domain-containing protein [Gammaproteobacteria bacterium]MBU1962705.1 HipA domain-containing protein [Gammaproteobacteria bacterium]